MVRTEGQNILIFARSRLKKKKNAISKCKLR